MTVARLRSEMGNDEFVAWSAWHGMRAQHEELAARRLGHG